MRLGLQPARGDWLTGPRKARADWFWTAAAAARFDSQRYMRTAHGAKGPRRSRVATTLTTVDDGDSTRVRIKKKQTVVTRKPETAGTTAPRRVVGERKNTKATRSLFLFITVWCLQFTVCM